MPHNITPVDAFTTPIPVLDDGDAVAASSTTPTIQALADRSLYQRNISRKMARDVAMRNWSSPAAIQSTGTWQGIAWSPTLGRFAAVGGTGKVMSNDSGYPYYFRDRTSPTTRAFTAICWSSTKGFCAVSSDAGVANVNSIISTDSITWTANALPSVRAWSSICWSPTLGLFCAVSADGVAAGQIAVSLDGVTWVAKTSPFTGTLQCVCWSETLQMFCAVGDDGAVNGKVIVSTDGTTWTVAATNAGNTWKGVCAADALGFCVVGSDATTLGKLVLMSADSITWSLVTTIFTGSSTLRSVAWSPQFNMLCAVSDLSGPSQVLIGPDGTNWEGRLSATTNLHWTDICWAPEQTQFCAVASDGTTAQQVMCSL